MIMSTISTIAYAKIFCTLCCRVLSEQTVVAEGLFKKTTTLDSFFSATVTFDFIPDLSGANMEISQSFDSCVPENTFSSYVNMSAGRTRNHAALFRESLVD